MSEEQRMRAQLEREIRDRKMIERLQRAKIAAYETALQRMNEDIERAWSERDRTNDRH